MSIRLGIDVGGTFTDFLLFDGSTGAMHLLKTPSTPADQSVGIHNGIDELVSKTGVPTANIEALLHGTTVSTNIVLEEKGAKVGLLVTQGFEQVLHLARSQTPGPLAGWMTMVKPDPLADLEFTRGIDERISAKGDIISPMNEALAKESIRELLDGGIDCITVSLMHSYADPRHEKRLKAMIQEMDSDIPVSLSSELLPEFCEYERTLVTVMNAYLQPSMRRYLKGFEDKLHNIEFNPKVNIVRSDGGLMGIEHASERPVYTMLSGPAGGVVGAAYLADLTGYPNVLGFDMGGTSTDVSLIQDGAPTVSRQTQLGYYSIKIPSVEVHSVGAGGGSIAHVPMTGALRVGPDSAGARPGPACYGHGSGLPTVTDANVVLGRLPTSLLGGDMALDVSAAENAIAKLGDALGLDLHRTAEGIVKIVNENMFGALRLVSVQKGLDPRDFALVAFGGAGPLHGNAMGILAGCFPVIVPLTPGVLSALGFLYSDIKNEFTQTFARILDDVNVEAIIDVLTDLGTQANAWLGEEGIGEVGRKIRYQADVRYFRQGYEFTLEADPVELRRNGLAGLATIFGAAHERQYGFKLDQPVEIVNMRVIASGAVDKVEFPNFELSGTDASAALIRNDKVYFDGNFVSSGFYERDKLRAGNQISGPAIILQKDSTCVIHPGYIGEVDEFLNILIHPEGQLHVRGNT